MKLIAGLWPSTITCKYISLYSVVFEDQTAGRNRAEISAGRKIKREHGLRDQGYGAPDASQ